MGTVEFLFAGLLRFLLITFLLLGASLCVVRIVQQPMERIRVIQVSLLTAFVTLVVCIADVGPAWNLAWLPAVAPAQAVAHSNETVTREGSETRQNDLQTAKPSSLDGGAAATGVPDGGSIAWSPTHTSSVGTTPRAAAADGFAFPSQLRKVLTFAFLLVSLLHGAYLWVGFIATRRLVLQTTPLSDDARARVELVTRGFATRRDVAFVTSDAIDVPMVAGLWRSTILLPARLTRPDVDMLELKHSLAHEWSHLELRDLATWQLVSLCQLFLWIQPCYWILRRELRVAQDQLADQFAIEQTRDRTAYATTLLGMSNCRQAALPGALAMAAGRSNLYRRIEMLMHERFRVARATRTWFLLTSVILFIAVAGLLNSLQLTHAASGDVSKPANATNESVGQDAHEISDGSDESAEHSGVVVDADTGQPIAGVTVTVTRMESHDWQELAVTESITDANGRFVFTIPPEQLSEPLLYIMFDVAHPEYAQRHCGSYGYGMIVANLENGEQPWFSKLKMVRGEKINGRLVDENQQPVAGAQIRCDCSPKSGYDRVRSASIDSISDEEGRFELTATYSGIAKLSIVPREHGMKYVNLGEKRGDIGDIALATGFRVHGIVQDAKGNPMTNLWVNITPEEERNEISYEMKRSAKTDEQGRFESRPLNSGKYLFEVQLKATGALEKLKYANFHDTPPSAMFVDRSINVTEDSSREPLVIRAVPHVLITVQHFTPKGEISSGHSPSVMGTFDGQRMWIRDGQRTGKGAYELMAPHGFEDVELRFTTNEHSGLMVQFEGGESSPQDEYRFERLEEDIANVRVVRYPAGILKLDIVDESGVHLDEGHIFARYVLQDEPSEEMMMAAQIGWNREDGLFRLSSIVPNIPVSIQFGAPGFQSLTETFTLAEGERRMATIKLTQADKDVAAE
ncbi:MAG: hypothetical protein KDA61_10930 [Planctomycetales bacterium]|nr:hypothetical protein [Planctomycetales bacterium]